MKMKALSYYDGDTDTRFGDCILLYDSNDLIVYDCGHERHAEEVEKFLVKTPSIKQVYIVVSHNDSDHTDGIIGLMDYLHNSKYSVSIYISLYLKKVTQIMDILDNKNRTRKGTRDRILKMFDSISDIVLKAEEYEFCVKEAAIDEKVSKATIVGPTQDEIVGVVAKAIKTDNEGAQIDGETVMNAASIQLKVKLDNAQELLLLCGDATPEYLHRLNNYDIIQLPHHGKLSNAQKIFEELGDDKKYEKVYLISDNTGSGATSGGSEELEEYMDEENFSPAKNTRKGVVSLPERNVGGTASRGGGAREVKLGEVDRWCW